MSVERTNQKGISKLTSRWNFSILIFDSSFMQGGEGLKIFIFFYLFLSFLGKIEVQKCLKMFKND